MLWLMLYTFVFCIAACRADVCCLAHIFSGYTCYRQCACSQCKFQPAPGLVALVGGGFVLILCNATTVFRSKVAIKQLPLVCT